MTKNNESVNQEELDVKEVNSTSNDKKKSSNKATVASTNTKTPSTAKSSKTKQKQANNEPKKLTLTNINKLSSKFNEKRKVYLNIDGEEFEVLLEENFRRTDIQKVSVDYIKFLYALRSMGEIDEEVIMSTAWMVDVLVLKHFTNIPIPKDTEDPSKLLLISKNLVDLGIVEELLHGGKNSFSKKNTDLVKEQVEKALENMGSVLSELGLKAELSEIEKNRIDVDNYFSELEMRNFDIAEDEDLEMLLQVIDQLNADGTYQKYMDKLTSEETDKLSERMDKLQAIKGGDEENEKVH